MVDIIFRNQNIIQYLCHKLRLLNSNIFIMLFLFAITMLRFRNLGHQTIKYWDELFHAIVSRNLMKHFLMPTLYDQPFLSYDYTNWTHNYIWLHKPPIPLWQIAISYHLFGVNTFALRLPSAILSILAVFITYMVGSELYDRKVGFIAAFLQAVNPLMMKLVHGYVFSDHIDIALVFWVELSCYLLIKAIKTGKTKYYIWSGVAQGLGYISKSYLCLICFGLAVAILILTRTGVLKSQKANINIKKVITQILFSILVASPWVIFCLVKYTKEFIQENKMVMAHLYTEVEIWEKPWDCHLFDYMPIHYPYWYLIIFVSFFFLLVFALRHRTLGDLYTLIWIVGVVLPLSISVSKVPAGTDIATPALLIGFASVFLKIIRGNHRISTVIYFALIFSLFFLSQWPIRLFDGLKENVLSVVAHITAIGNISPSLYGNAWIIYQFLCYVVALVPFVVIYIILETLHRNSWQRICVKLLKVLLVTMVIALVYPLTTECVKVTDKKTISYDDYNTEGYDMDGFKDTGYFIKNNLPANSAILLETSVEYDRHYLMFYADRSTYQLVTGSNSAVTPENDPSTVGIKNNGGIPYLVSVKDYNYLCLYKSPLRPYYRIYDLK